MWAAAVIVGALVGVGLSCWSVALGFTFLVLPIAVCELLLFGALYLLRLGLSPEDDPRETQREWEVAARYPRLNQGWQDQRHAPFAAGPARRAGQSIASRRQAG